MKVPFANLDTLPTEIKNEVSREISKVINSGHFILGPFVEEFEEDLADRYKIHKSQVVGVSSGTDALLAAMMSVGVKPGNYVITSPFTFFATVGSIMRLGAMPLFVDIDDHTFNITPAQIEFTIDCLLQNEKEKVRAIIPVHLFGYATDLSLFYKRLPKLGVEAFLIEDAAQAFDSMTNGHIAGTMGDFGCLSFFPTKTLGCFGDGGAVICKNKDMADVVRMVRAHGASKDKRYAHDYLGGNFRLDAIQAAVLSVMLRHVDGFISHRRKIGAYYTRRFQSGTNSVRDQVRIPSIPAEDSSFHTFAQYTIVVSPDIRDLLRINLSSRGVSTQVYYPIPAHRQPVLGPVMSQASIYPVAERMSQSVISLPCHPGMTEDQAEYVVSCIEAFLEMEARKKT